MSRPFGAGTRGTARKGPVSAIQQCAIALQQTLALHSTIPFGHGLGLLEGAPLADAVVKHRLVKSFELPDRTASTKRRDASISATIAYDAGGVTSFNWMELSIEHRQYWIAASAWLAETFRGFRPSYRFVPPTGESARASGGFPHLAYKLTDPNAWECSLEALPYVVNILYTNHHLRKGVKAKYRQLVRARYPGNARKQSAEYQWLYEDALKDEGKAEVGYLCFTRMVRSVMTFNGVSRMTTVPKSNSEDRVITCEPYWNMVAQLSLMNDIRDHVRKRTGIDLTTLADLHKTLTHHASLATIDLKKASNSVWTVVVRQLWPSRVWSLLERLRCPHTSYTLTGDIEEYHYFNMFSPMGCGLTFDVMTWTLLALAKATGPGLSSVFGDDVIISVDRAEKYVQLLRALGMEINVDKTFLSGNFRESCGAFTDLTSGRLVTYELTYPTDIKECKTLFNKLLVISEAGQISPVLRKALRETLSNMYTSIHADAVMDVPPQLSLSLIHI